MYCQDLVPINDEVDYVEEEGVADNDLTAREEEEAEEVLDAEQANKDQPEEKSRTAGDVQQVHQQFDQSALVDAEIAEELIVADDLVADDGVKDKDDSDSESERLIIDTGE